MDEQAEAEKLRVLRAKIEHLMREADVCGSVVLAGREGRLESMLHVTASWSDVLMERRPGGDYLRLRSMKDGRPTPDMKRERLEWSLGMVSGMGEILATVGMRLLEAAKIFDEATGAEHTPLKRDDPRDDPD